MESRAVLFFSVEFNSFWNSTEFSLRVNSEPNRVSILSGVISVTDISSYGSRKPRTSLRAVREFPINFLKPLRNSASLPFKQKTLRIPMCFSRFMIRFREIDCWRPLEP